MLKVSCDGSALKTAIRLFALQNYYAQKNLANYSAQHFFEIGC